jgi:predicted DNA-binding protein (MmcQ/YjbR family)
MTAVTRDEVLELCSSLPGSVEDYPFGDDAAVFKVGGKMFALVMLTGAPGTVNLKCDPDWALDLRATYAAVRPGYHMNKRHWNTIDLDGTVGGAELREMIDHSYELVVSRLPRVARDRLAGR